jgi:hypothetical protein
MLAAFDAAQRAGGVPRWKPSGGFSAKCPAHADRSPSLSVDVGMYVPVVVRCFAGFEVADVLAAWGLTFRDISRDTLEGIAARTRSPEEARAFGAAGILPRDLANRYATLAAFDAAVPGPDPAEAVAGAVLAFPTLTLGPTGHGITAAWFPHRPALRRIVEAAEAVAASGGSTAAVTLEAVADELDREAGVLEAVGGPGALHRLARSIRAEHVAAQVRLLAVEVDR